VKTSEIIAEIEMLLAMLASNTTPAHAVQVMQAMVDELRGAIATTQ